MKSEFKSLQDEDKFGRKYACHYHNHCGASKIKRRNRKTARAKLEKDLLDKCLEVQYNDEEGSYEN